MHSFFQEQMKELNREQRQILGPQSDDEFSDINIDGGNRNQISVSGGAKNDSNSSLSSHDMAEQMNDWKTEQVQVFGEQLTDRNDSGSTNPSTNNTTSTDTNDDDDDDLEERLNEREARYEFSPEERAAWGESPPDPEAMKNILEQVALERQKELEYSKSASLSPSSPPDGNTNSNSSKSIPAPTLSLTQQETLEHHEYFSHVSVDGEGVHMVDVGHKVVTPRTAHARSEVWLPPEVLEAFLPGAASTNNNTTTNLSFGELVGPKGPIFATAKIAGIMAAKKTSDLIPLCHPLPLDQVQLEIRLKDYDDQGDGGGTVVIDCICKVTHKTGVEMEALTGATVAALTIYDMTKAVSHNIRIQDTRLIGKTGGKRTVLDGRENTNKN